MKTRKILGLFLFLLIICITGCDSNDDISYEIDGLTVENYPIVDGSTSTAPLNKIIACKLFGWRYKWKQDILGSDTWGLYPNEYDVPDDFLDSRIKVSQTHNSIINLINNEADLILSARKMSADEKSYAENLGILLIETPIALDALDFIVNKTNTVSSLTVQQVQDIYRGIITNWKEVGGVDAEIKPFIRNANSGSQEMMKEIVMNSSDMADWDVAYSDDEILSTMSAVYTELSVYPNGICFSPHYFKEYIVRDGAGGDNSKSIAINKVQSNAKSIRNKTYPFFSNVYVSIRSDVDLNSMTYKLYEWLQTEAGKRVISESGYVPN